MTKSILVVLAHPDDETFGLGGTIALYAKNGYDVYYVCATRGEEGAADAEFMQGFESTAQMRTDELMRAAKILGLKDVYFLGYRDSGMPGTEANRHPEAQIVHSLDEVAGKVVKYIREIKPEIVITFDPIGGYRHPDHIHIQQATTLAFENADKASFHPEAGEPFKPRALYYQIFPRWFLKWTIRLMPLFGRDPRKFGRNKDIDLTDLVVEFPTHVRLNTRSVSGIKQEASKQHASQGGGQMQRGWMRVLALLFGENEDFMRVYPPVNGAFRRVKDLFEGI